MYKLRFDKTKEDNYGQYQKPPEAHVCQDAVRDAVRASGVQVAENIF